MNPIKLLSKSIVTILFTVVACMASARSNLYGGYLDSSENLYNASSYPTSADLQICKRNSGSTSAWDRVLAAPSGYRFSPQSIVRTDSAGDVFVACTLNPTAGSVEELAIVKYTSTGGYRGTFYYHPSSYGVQLEGFCIDKNDYVYAIAQFATSSTSGFNASFVLECNNLLSVTHAVTISDPNATTTLATDIVTDKGANVYIGSLAFNAHGAKPAMMITKYSESGLPSGFVWQAANGLPSSDYVLSTTYGNGCLSIDSSNRLDYIAGYDDEVNGTAGKYVVQRSTTDTLNWTEDFDGSPGDTVLSTQVDSAGNLYAVGPASTGEYTLLKYDSGGGLAWQTPYNGTSSLAQSLTLDASGEVEVVDTLQVDNDQKVGIQIFSASSGGYETEYTYEGNAGSDYGYNVFASESTTGTLYVVGIGRYDSNYYPLVFKIANDNFSWIYYETS